MTDIYEQHQVAFRNVSAFVVTYAGNRVATVALKFPKDGAGRLHAYIHWLGSKMVRGYADGYGYDKRLTAIQNAVPSMSPPEYADEKDKKLQEAFVAALMKNQSQEWGDLLRESGFAVLQAV